MTGLMENSFPKAQRSSSTSGAFITTPSPFPIRTPSPRSVIRPARNRRPSTRCRPTTRSAIITTTAAAAVSAPESTWRSETYSSPSPSYCGGLTSGRFGTEKGITSRSTSMSRPPITMASCVVPKIFSAKSSRDPKREGRSSWPSLKRPPRTFSPSMTEGIDCMNIHCFFHATESTRNATFCNFLSPQTAP